LCTRGQAHEEQEKDPHVTKILNFLSEQNIAIPSSRRKLTIKFMLEQLQELKWLGASIPAIPFFCFQPIISLHFYGLGTCEFSRILLHE